MADGEGAGVTDETAKPWRILEGDCAVTLAGLPAESIDVCVTDTPYGLSTLLDPPNLDREALWRKLTTWRENPRPLSVYVLAEFAAFKVEHGKDPTHDEMVPLIAAADRKRFAEGPAIQRLIHEWNTTGDNPKMTGRGFMGKEWDALVPSPNTWRAVWRVLKPGAYCFAFGGTRTADLISMSLRLADFEVDDQVMWLYGGAMPKRVRLSLKIDEHFEPKDQRRLRRAQAKREGRSIPPRECEQGQRFAEHDRALRPGWEPIIIAVKPLRGTVAENALRYGTGGLHVDACRLPRGDALVRPSITRDDNAVYGRGLGAGVQVEPSGGYPPNVALDEETAEALDRMSGFLHPAGNKTPVTFKNGNRIYGQYAPKPVHQLDQLGGGASRFFYVAKASSSERDAGLGDLPPLSAGERCDREDGSAGVNGYAGTRGEGGRNIHPTLKPIALMRWLCRLAAPPGAHDPDIGKRPVILDPFFGSGSTGVAALAEGLRVVGCEMMPEYVEIARRRCQHAYALPPDDPERAEQRMDTPGQKSLF